MTNNLKAFHKQIMVKFTKDLIEALNSPVCKQYFFDLMTQSIEEEVYNKYEPSEYERRREHGGLIDEANYSYRVSVGKDGIVVYMKNTTEGVKRAFMIDEGIVTGKDPVTGENFYEYGGLSHKITPRDFYGYMKVLIKRDDELERIIRTEMRKRNWKIN